MKEMQPSQYLSYLSWLTPHAARHKQLKSTPMVDNHAADEKEEKSDRDWRICKLRLRVSRISQNRIEMRWLSFIHLQVA